MVATKVPANLRSPRVLLGGSAIVDLLLRIPEDIFAPLVSIVGGTIARPPVGFITTWVMFGIALYTFAPLIFTYFDVLPRERPGFRVLFVLGTVALAIGLQQSDSSGLLLLTVLSGTIISGGLLLSYLVLYRDWVVLDHRSRTVALLEQMLPHDDVATEIEADLSYEGWLGIFARVAYVSVIVFILGAVCLLAAVVVRTLLHAFPLPDLLFLGWAISVRVLPRISIDSSRVPLERFEFDFERNLLSTLENATRSVLGLYCILFIVAGLLASGMKLSMVSVVAPQWAEFISRLLNSIGSGLPREAVLALWNLTGLLLLILLAGGYGFWAWVRELYRLPYFLDTWEPRQTKEDSQPIARSSGLTMIPSISWIAALAYASFDAPGVNIGYAILWPLIVVSGVWMIRHTYRRSPQPISDEYWWLVIGLLVQLMAVWLGANLIDVVTAFPDIDRLLSVLTVPIGFALLLIFATGFPLVLRYERRHDESPSYAMAGLLFLLGGCALVSWWVVPERYRALSLALLVFSWVSGLVLAMIRYHDL